MVALNKWSSILGDRPERARAEILTGCHYRRAGRRGLATGHRRERVRRAGEVGWKQVRSRAREAAGGRWAGGERPGRAAGPGRAADGLARKLGQGCMAENLQQSAVALGALIERLGRR